MKESACFLTDNWWKHLWLLSGRGWLLKTSPCRFEIWLCSYSAVIQYRASLYTFSWYLAQRTLRLPKVWYYTSRYRYPTPVPIRVCPRAICPGWVWDCCIQNKVVCSIPPSDPSGMGLGRQVLPRCRVDMWSGDSADTLELPPKVKPSPRDGSSPQLPCRAPPPGSCPAPRGSTWSGCRAPCPQRWRRAGRWGCITLVEFHTI